MLELQILGFLDDGPLHGYELRRRIIQLSGPGATLSEGTLYPALTRLERRSLVTRSVAQGARGRAKQVLSITPAGRERLRHLLREAEGSDVESTARFRNVLAFLSKLPDLKDQRAILLRRLTALQTPPSFFTSPEGRPQRLGGEDDPYRRCMLLTARASRNTELAWLREQLDAMR
ncbi:PadR family transcriptional regulator [Actinomyces trachealis]|uniref:PadR family transcriptional regulator n=1 Tax=Actinomyces trachealis TaxID=2763540 RepID=UPI001892B945|nr:PadR family transcriptional regulator [Actinomyces trachealis]